MELMQQFLDFPTLAIGAGLVFAVYKLAQKSGPKESSSSSSSSLLTGAGAVKCQLSATEFTKVVLTEKISLTTGVVCPVTLYRFALPDSTKPLGLPIGKHISTRFVSADGKEVMRSYTPTSSDDDVGHFDLVIKVYPTGVMSKYIDSLKIGDTLDVRGPKGSFQYQKNAYKKIGMIAGGTGITPMLQIAREILKHKDDKTQVSLVFGNVTADDIILKDRLDKLEADHPDRFHVHHVLNNPPQGWTQGVGFISQLAIKENLPAPGDGVRILMCGPPPMLKAMESHLESLKYPKESIFNF
eukprot:ANDGO_04218.mRNA.1 NADH-cytochrome b5 reductase 1